MNQKLSELIDKHTTLDYADNGNTFKVCDYYAVICDMPPLIKTDEEQAIIDAYYKRGKLAISHEDLNIKINQLAETCQKLGDKEIAKLDKYDKIVELMQDYNDGWDVLLLIYNLVMNQQPNQLNEVQDETKKH